MAALKESDWRRPDPANMLYMRLPQGEVVIELAPDFAPVNVANIKTLVKEEYFDGLAVIRSQDNYVVQWGDPAEEDQARPFGSAKATVAPEFFRALDGLEVTTLDSLDAYADTVGFRDGFPVGSDGERVWLTHCYGMVGVARGNEPNSGNGSSLYVITGHAPRHLDRNITLAGRVLSGIEYLTTLPRGTGSLGFYESADENDQLNPAVLFAAPLRLDVNADGFQKSAWQNATRGYDDSIVGDGSHLVSNRDFHRTFTNRLDGGTEQHSKTPSCFHFLDQLAVLWLSAGKCARSI